MGIKHFITAMGGLVLSAFSACDEVPFSNSYESGVVVTAKVKVPRSDGTSVYYDTTYMPTLCNCVSLRTAQSGEQCYVTIRQVSVQLKGTNEFITITPVTASQSYWSPTKDLQRSINMAQGFMAWISNNSRTDAERYGGYTWTVSFKASGSETVLVNGTFIWTYAMANEASGTTGAVNQSDIKNALGLYGDYDDLPSLVNAQNVNKDGFWQSLFVPQDSNVQLVKDECVKFANWGPFGIFSAVNGTFATANGMNDNLNQADNSQSGDFDKKYIIWFAGYAMDLTPYSGLIHFMRLIMAGALWCILIFAIWKWIGRKV